MSIENRAPGIAWALRYDINCGYVYTDEDDTVSIVLPDFGHLRKTNVSRKDARLLAKRINECLDATVRR